MPSLRTIVLLVVLSAPLSGPLAAQTTAVVEGVVTDPSGSVVVGASVRLTQQESGAERRAAANAVGYYAAPGLAPGLYSIEVSHPGFQSQVRRRIELSAGRSRRFDFVLEIGEQREEVSVEAETNRVSVSVADWGDNVRQEDMADLPLNGRDLFELAAYRAGVAAPTSPERNDPLKGLGGQLSVFGARPRQNSFQIDGVFVNDATGSAPGSAGGALLGIESIRELRVVASPYSAEYGRVAGGVFTAVSKSGTNRLHGALYEYFRNSALDAKNFFDSAEEEIPPLKRNQFGAVVSGPIRRDRLFFLVNYEGVRERRSSTVRPSVPTEEARQGFLPGADGETIQIQVAEQMKPFLDLYPLPNGRDFGDGTAEFVTTVGAPTDDDFVTGKLDWVSSDRLRFAARYSFDRAESLNPDPLGVFEFGLESRNHFLHSDLQWIRSPNTVANFRFAFSRIRTFEGLETTDRVAPGLTLVKGQALGSIETPGLTFIGGFPARGRPRRFLTNIYQFNADAIHVRGRHTVKFGAGFDVVQFDLNAPVAAGGGFNFNSLADLLQARASHGNVMAPGSDAVRGWRYNRVFAFLQDEFRITPRLTLSLGVRYETASTPSEVDGKIGVLRDPLRDAEVTVGGPLFRNPSRDNFAPRGSLAWDPAGSGKTVVRVGAGLFHDLLGSREVIVAGTRTPPFFVRLNVSRPEFPDILKAAADTQPPKSLDGLEFRINQPYVARWQFSVERQLFADAVLRLSYTGARGIHLMGQVGNDNPTAPVPQDDGRLFFPAGGPRVNPAWGRIGLRRSQFNSFYQGFTAGVEGRWTPSFRAQANYTFSKSIDEASSEIFTDFQQSDQIPTVLNYRLNRGLSDFDARHVFSLTYSYEFPRLENSPWRRLAGGWEMHGIFQAQSGHPFAPTVGFDRANLRPAFGDLGQRPDFVAAPGSDIIEGDPSRWFNPEAFALPEAGFLGTLGRGTLTGPRLFNLDFSLHKLVWNNERQRVLFRAEFFNIANHPNFAMPSGLALFNNRGGRVGTAGRIDSTSTASRQVQLALRWEF